jgi:hypothetical protein
MKPQSAFRGVCRNYAATAFIKGQFGHIDNRDPIELLGRERGKRMVWEATDAKKARMSGKVTRQLGFRKE